ncbi:MAG: hypothetical protein IIA54_08050, partial [Chloroflexi bacterium]|nr:hypothetical protein [Chloroflexota bacterium]
MGLILQRLAIDSDRPETAAQLHAFFVRLGFSVATQAVMPGMTSPMEALWHIYRRTWPVLQLMGGRGSGKTRGLSLVEAAKAKFYPGYSIAHIGATKAQANRCYGYIREYVGPGGGLRGDVWKTRLTDTSWRNGSHMEVLAGTVNAVSGGHPVLMSIDEFDLLDPQVFQQAIGMPQSNVASGYQSQIVLTSALYHSNGNMRTLLNSDQPPVTLRWTVFDAMEPCDGRHGRPACLDAIAHHAGQPPSNPARCPLWDICQGRAQYATGHKAREDVIHEFELTDDFTWRTQYMSMDAERAGLVYERFAPDLSDDGSTNVTEAAEYDPQLDVYWGADEGFENPSVVLLMQRTRDGGFNVFDEIYVSHMDHEEVLDLVHQPRGLDGKSRETWYVRPPGAKPRGPYKKPRRAFPDPSAKQFARVISKRLKSAA